MPAATDSTPPPWARSPRQWGLKRLFDVVVSGGALVALAPLFAILAVAIKLDSPGPVFFGQSRVGRAGRPFWLLKFRSMAPNADQIGLGLAVEAGDQRITRVGGWLRRYSIDELPQLINIWLGDMSLIGPRPTLAYQVERYTPAQRRRLMVRPGLTGWAQVNGRNRLTWPERIALDLEYIDRWSLWLDLIILARTPAVMFDQTTLYTPWVVDEISAPPAQLGGPAGATSSDRHGATRTKPPDLPSNDANRRTRRP